MKGNFSTILLLVFLLCSSSIYSQKEGLKNVQIEFQTEIVPGGILHKFEQFFENVAYDEVEDSDLLDQEYDEDETEEYTEEEQEIRYDSDDVVQELNEIISNNVNNKTEEDI